MSERPVTVAWLVLVLVGGIRTWVRGWRPKCWRVKNLHYWSGGETLRRATDTIIWGQCKQTYFTIVMSSFAQHGNDAEEIQPPQRPPSPPPHTTFAVRGVHVRLVSPSTFERYSHDRGSVS